MRLWLASRVVLIALVALLASACTEPQAVVLGENDSGRVVEIEVGQQLTVQLPSNMTTGFQWAVAEPGPVSQVGEPIYEAPQESGLVGAGGTQTFTFEAKAAGSGELRLEYRRPWENDVTVQEAWSASITVK